MKRKKVNYHNLHVLKSAQANLRKAIITNFDTDVLNCISEVFLNVKNGNITLTGCDTCRQKLALRKLVDKQIPLSGKKRLIVQRGALLLSLLAAVLPTLISIIAAK